MAYRIILVPMMGDAADSSALDAVRAITQRMRCHVVGIHVRDPIGTAFSGATLDTGWMTPGLLQALEEDWRAGSAAAGGRFRQWQDANGIESRTSPSASAKVSAEWKAVQAPVVSYVAEQARTADLVVLARSARHYAADADRILQGALFESGRPVLLVPGDVGANPFDTVVIAWNDSREAAHAVAAAWSLVGRARRVIVFIGGADEALRRSADRFAAHLAWRGYAPATVINGAGPDIGAGLLDVAARERAGMIVMGAYTHSRLRQFVFGGTTSHVLAHATVPVLMAH